MSVENLVKHLIDHNSPSLLADLLYIDPKDWEHIGRIEIARLAGQDWSIKAINKVIKDRNAFSQLRIQLAQAASQAVEDPLHPCVMQALINAALDRYDVNDPDDLDLAESLLYLSPNADLDTAADSFSFILLNDLPRYRLEAIKEGVKNALKWMLPEIQNNARVWMLKGRLGRDRFSKVSNMSWLNRKELLWGAVQTVVQQDEVSSQDLKFILDNRGELLCRRVGRLLRAHSPGFDQVPTGLTSEMSILNRVEAMMKEGSQEENEEVLKSLVLRAYLKKPGVLENIIREISPENLIPLAGAGSSDIVQEIGGVLCNKYRDLFISNEQLTEIIQNIYGDGGLKLQACAKERLAEITDIRLQDYFITVDPDFADKAKRIILEARIYKAHVVAVKKEDYAEFLFDILCVRNEEGIAAFADSVFRDSPAIRECWLDLIQDPEEFRQWRVNLFHDYVLNDPDMVFALVQRAVNNIDAAQLEDLLQIDETNADIRDKIVCIYEVLGQYITNINGVESEGSWEKAIESVFDKKPDFMSELQTRARKRILNETEGADSIAQSPEIIIRSAIAKASLEELQNWFLVELFRPNSVARVNQQLIRFLKKLPEFNPYPFGNKVWYGEGGALDIQAVIDLQIFALRCIRQNHGKLFSTEVFFTNKDTIQQLLFQGVLNAPDDVLLTLIKTEQHNGKKRDSALEELKDRILKIPGLGVLFPFKDDGEWKKAIDEAADKNTFKQLREAAKARIGVSQIYENLGDVIHRLIEDYIDSLSEAERSKFLSGDEESVCKPMIANHLVQIFQKVEDFDQSQFVANVNEIIGKRDIIQLKDRICQSARNKIKARLEALSKGTSEEQNLVVSYIGSSHEDRNESLKKLKDIVDNKKGKNPLKIKEDVLQYINTNELQGTALTAHLEYRISQLVDESTGWTDDIIDADMGSVRQKLISDSDHTYGNNAEEVRKFLTKEQTLYLQKCARAQQCIFWLKEIVKEDANWNLLIQLKALPAVSDEQTAQAVYDVLSRNGIVLRWFDPNDPKDQRQIKKIHDAVLENSHILSNEVHTWLSVEKLLGRLELGSPQDAEWLNQILGAGDEDKIREVLAQNPFSERLEVDYLDNTSVQHIWFSAWMTVLRLRLESLSLEGDERLVLNIITGAPDNQALFIELVRRAEHRHERAMREIFCSKIGCTDSNELVESYLQDIGHLRYSAARRAVECGGLIEALLDKDISIMKNLAVARSPSDIREILHQAGQGSSKELLSFLGGDITIVKQVISDEQAARLKEYALILVDVHHHFGSTPPQSFLEELMRLWRTKSELVREDKRHPVFDISKRQKLLKDLARGDKKTYVVDTALEVKGSYDLPPKKLYNSELAKALKTRGIILNSEEIERINARIVEHIEKKDRYCEEISILREEIRSLEEVGKRENVLKHQRTLIINNRRSNKAALKYLHDFHDPKEKRLVEWLLQKPLVSIVQDGKLLNDADIQVLVETFSACGDRIEFINKLTEASIGSPLYIALDKFKPNVRNNWEQFISEEEFQFIRNDRAKIIIDIDRQLQDWKELFALSPSTFSLFKRATLLQRAKARVMEGIRSWDKLEKAIQSAANVAGGWKSVRHAKELKVMLQPFAESLQLYYNILNERKQVFKSQIDYLEKIGGYEALLHELEVEFDKVNSSLSEVEAVYKRIHDPKTGLLKNLQETIDKRGAFTGGFIKKTSKERRYGESEVDFVSRVLRSNKGWLEGETSAGNQLLIRKKGSRIEGGLSTSLSVSAGSSVLLSMDSPIQGVIACIPNDCEQIIRIQGDEIAAATAAAAAAALMFTHRADAGKLSTSGMFQEVYAAAVISAICVAVGGLASEEAIKRAVENATAIPRRYKFFGGTDEQHKESYDALEAILLEIIDDNLHSRVKQLLKVMRDGDPKGSVIDLARYVVEAVTGRKADRDTIDKVIYSVRDIRITDDTGKDAVIAAGITAAREHTHGTSVIKTSRVVDRGMEHTFSKDPTATQPFPERTGRDLDRAMLALMSDLLTCFPRAPGLDCKIHLREGLNKEQRQAAMAAGSYLLVKLGVISDSGVKENWKSFFDKARPYFNTAKGTDEQLDYDRDWSGRGSWFEEAYRRCQGVEEFGEHSDRIAKLKASVHFGKEGLRSDKAFASATGQINDQRIMKKHLESFRSKEVRIEDGEAHSIDNSPPS